MCCSCGLCSSQKKTTMLFLFKKDFHRVKTLRMLTKVLLRGSKDSFSSVKSVGCTEGTTCLCLFPLYFSWFAKTHVTLQMWYCTTNEKTGEKSSDAFPMTCFRRFVLRFIFAETVSSDKFELTFFQAAYLLWLKSSDSTSLAKVRVTTLCDDKAPKSDLISTSKF